jgi:ribosome-associated protein
MLSYRSMEKNKTINEDIAAPRWTKAAPEVDADEPISKTQLKAIADEQQALGVRLLTLGKDKLVKLNLPEALFEALMDSKKITANGAIKRHKQYLGRLMRDVDPAPIEEQLASWDGKNNKENARFHDMERWRTRLLSDEKDALSAFIEKYPLADRQQMRTLIRNAAKEEEKNKSPKSSRELFKLIRTAIDDFDAAASAAASQE